MGILTKTFIVLVALAFIVQLGINYGLRKQYPVHSSGVILITGSSTGIGNHAVFEIAKMNYTVFLYCTIKRRRLRYDGRGQNPKS